MYVYVKRNLYIYASVCVFLYDRIMNGQLSSDPVIAAIQLGHHAAVTSTRQPAEWGMHLFQGTFARLHTSLPYNSFLRGMIIVCCMHLLNLRTRIMGVNQIRTVFDPNYIPNIFASKDASRIHRYYDVY